MAEFAREVVPVNIEEEMKQSYLDYAMSVIVGRALPDVRDGLKPVHRRVLFAMRELGNDWNKPFKKSARVVGDTVGKFHPHGDGPVYEALVRMAQSFSLRYTLIDGQGNFGSVDGDPPAAMRYTEVRMARIAHELLADIEKETVDFVPNYDESESEPAVFPTRLPNLLINGAAGIAVGMATNVPPHNLSEVIDACVASIDDPDISIEDLMGFVPGPDFPTAGLINGAAGIREAYRTGRGRLHVRSKAHIEAATDKQRESIVVTELPYQVNKARLLEKIAFLVKEKRLEGIAELRDESDKDGMRMVIELRRGAMGDVVLNNLFQYTQMETVYGMNLVALVDGQPRLLNLKMIIDCFIRHRREVVTRRTLFDLRKARDRCHVLEGLAIALTSIDPIIEMIKASSSPAEARQGLLGRRWPPGVVADMLGRSAAGASRPDDLSPEFGLAEDGYRLSERQARAILDLQLHRLTGLEQEKIIAEYDEILVRVEDLLDILSNPSRLRTVIKDELLELKAQYGDARQTEIMDVYRGFDPADLVTPEDVVVTMSHSGYIKWQPLSVYSAQKRGGKGRRGTSTKDEDFVEQLIVANTHDTVLLFSSRGKVYWKQVYELPTAGPTARGSPIVNLLPLEDGERITAIAPMQDFQHDGYVLMATASGLIKKTEVVAYSRPRSTGLIAIDLKPDDTLVGIAVTDGAREVILTSNNGKAVRFAESEVRPMGRGARGVIGMRLGAGDRVISLMVVSEGSVLSVTANGYGKRTAVSEYPRKGRGTRGVISIQTTERNGEVVAALLVQDSDEIMLISDNGIVMRTRIGEMRTLGRNTQGVTLMDLREGERVVGVQSMAEMDEDLTGVPVTPAEAGESHETGDTGEVSDPGA